MRIAVTAEHIRRGERLNGACCPIALALRNILPDRWIRVCGSRAEVGVGRLVLPRECVTFQERFDLGMPVEPFEFEAK